MQEFIKAESYGRAIDSMNMSTPLLRYSYRPAINIWTNGEIRRCVESRVGKDSHIKSVFKVEVVMSIEMAADEFVDLRL